MSVFKKQQQQNSLIFKLLVYFLNPPIIFDLLSPSIFIITLFAEQLLENIHYCIMTLWLNQNKQTKR